MKKFTVSFLILLCLSLNIIVTPVAAANIFKEGLYKVSDYKFSPDNIYNIENVSSSNNVYMLVFNGDQVVQQSLRLEPKSQKYVLPLLKPDYIIVIVGGGEVSIS